jgi:cyanoexosortase A
VLIHITQNSGTLLSVAFVVWWGAWLCSEDMVLHMQPRPSAFGVFAGCFTLVLCLLRGINTVHPDELIISLLAPVAGIALALLYAPCKLIGRFRSSLFILALLPLHILFIRILPEKIISFATATSSGVLLRAAGNEVALDGRRLLLQNGGVNVWGPCNGSEQIALLLIVSFTFLIVFPLRKPIHKAIVLVACPLFAMACNSVRIAMLASFAGSPSPHGDWLFNFFHHQQGSLIFSLISVSLFSLLYLSLLHRQLNPRTL